MNEVRQLYLKTYRRIDQANRRMSNFGVGIKTMKYWHSAMDYAFQLTLVQSYDFYVEAAKGDSKPEWAIDSKKLLISVNSSTRCQIKCLNIVQDTVHFLEIE